MMLDDNNVLQITNVRYAFPLLQFLGISPSNNFLIQGGLEGQLCRRCGKCCSCSDDCMQFNTCCIDKFWDTVKPLQLHVYVEMFLKKSREYKKASYKTEVCGDAMPLAKTQGHTSERFVMITSCMNEANEREKSNCLQRRDDSLAGSIRVFGSDKYIYKNRYCALCNNITKFENVAIHGVCKEKRRAQVPQNDTLNVGMYFAGCTFKIAKGQRARMFIKRCPADIGMRRNCNGTNTNYNLCKAYKGKVSGFANYHCLKCNSNLTSVLNTAKFCNVSCGLIGPTTPPRRCNLPWSLLLSPTGLKISEVLENRCHTASTSLPRKSFLLPVNTIYIVSNATFDRCLLAGEPIFLISYAKRDLNISEVISELKTALNFFDGKVTVYSNNETEIIASTGNVDSTKSHLAGFLSNYTYSTLPFYNNIEKVIIHSSKYHSISTLHNLNFSTSYPGGRACAQPVRLTNINAVFNSKCGVDVSGAAANQSDISAWPVNQSDISTWFEFHNGLVTRNIFACRRYYLHSTCSLRNLLADDFKVNHSQYLVHKTNKSIAYSVEQYIPTESGFAICGRNPSDMLTQVIEILYSLEGYIVVIGTCLSICSYILIIATHISFKALQNSGGLSALSMCCCLFLSDSLYLIAYIIRKLAKTNVFAPCAVVGILLHYWLLTTHTWSLVIAVDIATKFRGFNVAQRGRGRFYKSCAIAIGIPLVIIMLCIALHFTATLDFGYGDVNVCFVDTFYPRLGFYIIPAALIFLINLPLLIYTLIRVKKQRSATEQALGESNRSEVNITLIALRLVFIFGLSEVITFISIPNATQRDSEMVFNAIFSFLSTLLRSLRGVFLLVTYICRKQVIQLYRKCMTRKARTSGTT